MLNQLVNSMARLIHSPDCESGTWVQVLNFETHVIKIEDSSFLGISRDTCFRI